MSLLLQRILYRFGHVAPPAAALAICLWSIQQIAAHRVPLLAALGPWIWLLVAGLGTSLLACLGALVWALCPSVRLTRYSAPSTWRLFFNITVLQWAVQILWIQPYVRLGVLIGIALATGLFGCLATRRFTRKTSRGKASKASNPLARRLDLIVTLVCVTLAGTELGLRALAAWSPSPILEVGHVDVRARITAARYDPGTLRMGFPCNEGGYYDEEFTPKQPGEHLVVVIGDSFSAGVVPHFYHYTTVAERTPGATRIHNMGLPGLNPLDYIYLLEHEARLLHPDLIIVSLFIGNDIIQGWPRTDPLRSWFDRSNVLLWQVPKRLMRVMSEKQSGADAHGFDPTRDIESSDPAELERRYPWLVDPLLEKPTFSSETFLEIERRRARNAFSTRRTRFKILLACIEQMRQAASPVPLAVMLIPDESQVEEGLWRQIVSGSAAGEMDRFMPQRVLTRELAARRIPCLNLLEDLRALAPLDDGRRHAYHGRDTHLNARGNAVAGHDLARFITSLLR